MPRSTQDCKNFLVEFFTKNPSPVLCVFGDPYNWPVDNPNQPSMDELIKLATDPRQWKREYKCNVGSDSSYIQGTCDIYDINQICHRCGYDRIPKQPAANFIIERGFVLAEQQYESTFRFIVLEDKEGYIYLSDYIGD